MCLGPKWGSPSKQQTSISHSVKKNRELKNTMVAQIESACGAESTTDLNIIIWESLHKCIGASSLVRCLQLPARRPDLTVCQRELDLWVMELLSVLTLAQRDRYGGCFDDLNAGETHTVRRCHLIIHLLNCSIQACVTVLLVHVMIPCPALKPHPDTKVLGCCWVFLKNLQSRKKNRFDLALLQNSTSEKILHG